MPAKSAATGRCWPTRRHETEEIRATTKSTATTDRFAVDVTDDVAAIQEFAQALLFVHQSQPDANSDVWKTVHRLALEISLRAHRLQTALERQPKAAG